jgi:hypothetical protein
MLEITEAGFGRLIAVEVPQRGTCVLSQPWYAVAI